MVGMRKGRSLKKGKPLWMMKTLEKRKVQMKKIVHEKLSSVRKKKDRRERTYGGDGRGGIG